METAKELRKLIAAYRERLARGGGTRMTEFILEKIEEAERKLAEMEWQPPSKD
jgi:hypothetical protein